MQEIRQCVGEVIGTFYLCFAGISAILCTQTMGDVGPAAGLVMVALAHGLALSVAVCTFDGLSGAHFNPAVTCGMLATGRIKPPLAGKYIVAQLVGATVAALACSMVFPASAVDSAKLGIPLPPPPSAEWEIGTGTILLVEFICTFLLLTSIFGVVVDNERGQPVKIGGFTIGLTVAFAILAAGSVTGASMNPARSFGPALIHGHFDHHVLYWIAPIAGGVCASLLYHHFLLKTDDAPAEGG